MTRYPESSEIVWDGQAGCIGLFAYKVSLTQEGEQVVFSYAMGMAFQHNIPWAEFRQLWDALQPLDLSVLAEHYEGLCGTGDFSGTLTLTYQLEGQTFHKTIAIDGTAFAGDARMRQLYQTLTDFTDAHCRLENEHRLKTGN